MCASAVSLSIGIWEDPRTGWIEGTAILVAVFLVALVTAGNNYTKELQFRALEKSSQRDERTSVLRDGSIERINPIDLVVGDIIILQSGDSIPADSIILDEGIVSCNESALTGEAEDLPKSRDRDCFLLSSCLLTEAEDKIRAMVIGIGMSSQWGKIKANLVSESVNTPLQDKLEDMAGLIGYIGTGAAIGTFIAMVAFRALEKSSQRDERCSVLRNGVIDRVNPIDLVVGDIIILQAGDSIPADSILIDDKVSKISCNESSLTGEPEDLPKSKEKDCFLLSSTLVTESDDKVRALVIGIGIHSQWGKIKANLVSEAVNTPLQDKLESKNKDPFLLSSCLITEGEEAKALVIGIGPNSQWGKIKANLVSEAVNTPLQDKLENMAEQIGYIGLVAAAGTFIAMVISIWARHHGKDILGGFIEAFILSVTIIVVAIPEGLPLAVTIA
eukprot:CAMPEP_0174825842 /NCGR_PEP_ID=MMETSP1107-20130205/43165_1 /TAXON_ID=36770 /ORGANISM="Paraphysomonas vestita, Strain GFlagA" /LENGTH=444 /DNA_ID=CAMNT_0016057867 /DNA_START=347 /DNA_END=1679 /DNA_ORIENTATION=+